MIRTITFKEAQLRYDAMEPRDEEDVPDQWNGLVNCSTCDYDEQGTRFCLGCSDKKQYSNWKHGEYDNE